MSKTNLKAQVHEPTIQIKTNLSGTHMQSSILFASLCRKIEDEDQYLEWEGQHRYDENKQYALSAVIMAVGAMEAFINETFHDAISRLQSLKDNISEPKLALLEQLWPEVEEFRVLKKYQIALVVVTGHEMNTDAQPYQAAQALIRLRNMLVHYKPEWDDALCDHKKIEDRLRGYFDQNRLTKQAKGHMIWFPNKCLGAGCAQWACDTTKAFCAEFCKLMNIENKLI